MGRPVDWSVLYGTILYFSLRAGALGLAATATATFPIGRGTVPGRAAGGACCVSSFATGFATGLATGFGVGCGWRGDSAFTGPGSASRPMDLAAGALADIGFAFAAGAAVLAAGLAAVLGAAAGFAAGFAALAGDFFAMDAVGALAG